MDIGSPEERADCYDPPIRQHKEVGTFDYSGIFTGWTLSMSSNLADVDADGYDDMLVSEQSSGGAVNSAVYLLREFLP